MHLPRSRLTGQLSEMACAEENEPGDLMLRIGNRIGQRCAANIILEKAWQQLRSAKMSLVLG
jgi:hypothetical protein